MDKFPLSGLIVIRHRVEQIDDADNPLDLPMELAPMEVIGMDKLLKQTAAMQQLQTAIQQTLDHPVLTSSLYGLHRHRGIADPAVLFPQGLRGYVKESVLVYLRLCHVMLFFRHSPPMAFAAADSKSLLLIPPPWATAA